MRICVCVYVRVRYVCAHVFIICMYVCALGVEKNISAYETPFLRENCSESVAVLIINELAQILFARGMMFLCIIVAKL